MGKNDPYGDWIDDFDKEVDRVLGKERVPSLKPVREALAEFDDWWHREIPGTGEEPEFSYETQQVNKELEMSRNEVSLQKREIERLKSDPDASRSAMMQHRFEKLVEDREKLTQERDLLRGKSSGLASENKNLRDRLNGIKDEIMHLRIKMSQAQDGYESKIQQLEGAVSHLEKAVKEGKENKLFIEREHARLQTRLASMENESKSELEEKGGLEKKLGEMARKFDDLKRRLAGKDSQRTGLEVTIEELRLQATDLRERLIKSSEALDQEKGAERKELQKLFASNEELKNRLAIGQRESQMKVRETTRYLEMKIREIHDESKEQFGQFRELLDALVRFRGGSR